MVDLFVEVVYIPMRNRKFDEKVNKLKHVRTGCQQIYLAYSAAIKKKSKKVNKKSKK